MSNSVILRPMAKQLTPFEISVARRAGSAVRAMREARKLTCEDLAVLLQTSADAVAKAERGTRRFSLADIARLALEFDCSTDDLIFGPGPRPAIVRSSKVVWAAD